MRRSWACTSAAGRRGGSGRARAAAAGWAARKERGLAPRGAAGGRLRVLAAARSQRRGRHLLCSSAATPLVHGRSHVSTARRLRAQRARPSASHIREGRPPSLAGGTSDRWISSLRSRDDGSVSCFSSDIETVDCNPNPRGRNEIEERPVRWRRRDAGPHRPDVRADARHGEARRGTDREAGVQSRRRENPSGMPPGEAPHQAGRAARQDPRGARGEASAMTATRRRRPPARRPR
jgi:hypothetical protein